MRSQLRQSLSLCVGLGGYTDSQGLESHNLGMSQRRAEAARSDLLARGDRGEPARGEGFGESNPADNTTAEGRCVNRRTKVAVVD